MRSRQALFAILLPALLLTAVCVRAENGSALDAVTSTARDLASLHAMLRSPQPITWVFIGDSVTSGDKWTSGARDYTQLFCEQVRWGMGRGHDIIINTAISGNRTGDILRDFDWSVTHLHPNVVSLMIGMNDAVRGPAGELAFEANLRKLVGRIRAIGALPILQTTNWTLSDPRNAELSAYNAIIKDVAAQEHVILVDNWQYWHEHRNENNLGAWLGNRIHPNGLGHKAIADQMLIMLGMEQHHAN